MYASTIKIFSVPALVYNLSAFKFVFLIVCGYIVTLVNSLKGFHKAIYIMYPRIKNVVIYVLSYGFCRHL